MSSLAGLIFTESLHRFLWRYHRDKYALVTMFGHVELLTDIKEEYLKWVKTDEAKPYLKGGELYKEPH